MVIKRICVFCGASKGVRQSYSDAAERTGKLLAKRGIGLVYGGGGVGLMGKVAAAALAAGGEVIGIIPEALVTKEASQVIADLRIVGSMHERKAMMAELSDAFITLPGGFGTFEELSEILTWAQLGLHGKPCGVLNVDGFYDPLFSMYDHAVAEGFIPHKHRSLVLVEDDLEELLRLIENYEPPKVEAWIDRSET